MSEILRTLGAMLAGAIAAIPLAGAADVHATIAADSTCAADA